MKRPENNNARIPEGSIAHFVEEHTDYENFTPWKTSFEGANFFDWLKTKFSVFEESQVQNDKNMVIFRNTSTFAFRVSTDLLNINPSTLWNYWKDEIVDTGYSLQNSEIEYKDKLATLRYYLKPKLKFKMERDQRFGNITLELIQKEAKPQFIVMKCTWYVDYHFNPAKSYSELLEILTN